ncbi:kelch-like protein 40 [Biomphalaria pfeifferi]|uniref:Kelch-like protein 40 n=1 Tax=Biomphalaria pfeifferi TaxID=112525 RepID=A0AAD8B6J3_BIOPF|nr:kelch-like protein 40 [Biomphalaria pfeifferi]
MARSSSAPDSFCYRTLREICLQFYNYACVNFYRMAKLLDSKCVLEEMKYFTGVKIEAFFLELTAKELMELIESDALVVDSEDDVLFAIFKWVEGEDLQNCTGKGRRACLVSPYCLQVIFNHRLTQRDKEARKEIFNATLYQINSYRHGYFPAAAVRRHCDEYEHV